MAEHLAEDVSRCTARRDDPWLALRVAWLRHGDRMIGSAAVEPEPSS